MSFTKPELHNVLHCIVVRGRLSHGCNYCVQKYRKVGEIWTRGFWEIWAHKQTRWKVLWESTNPRESVFVANTWQHLPHLLFCGPLFPNFPTELFLDNRRFTEFFVRYFHIPVPIIMKHELGLLFPPRNLRIKFGANWSTIFLFIVVTDRQTQTTACENIFPRFRGDNKHTDRHTGHNALHPDQEQSNECVYFSIEMSSRATAVNARVRVRVRACVYVKFCYCT